MSLGLRTPEGNPAGVGQNLKEKRLPLSFIGGAETDLLKPPKCSSLRRKGVQFFGAVLIAGTSIIQPDAFFDRKSAQAEEPRFSDPSAKKLLEVKESMPSQSALKEMGVVITPAQVDPLDPCTNYTKIYADKYGPEESEGCLEKRYPLQISAHDYIKDSSGNVIKQRMVVNNNELWETAADPVTGAFSDFKFVSKITMGNATSMVSSTDGSTIIAGGEDPFRSGHTSLRISFDEGKTWQVIGWPYQDSASVIDLVRFTDTNYAGNNGNWEGGIGPFILSINPATKTAQVEAAQLASVQAVNLNIGSVHNFGISSVNTVSSTTEFIGTGSLNIQLGILRGRMDYLTGIGTVENITQTLISGIPVNLGYMYGWALHKDAQGQTRVTASDIDNQFLYEINIDVTPKIGTRVSYTHLCDATIPNLNSLSLGIGAIDKYFDSNGNLRTKLGGGGVLIGGSSGRAIMADLESADCVILGSNFTSGIERQKDMLRQQYKGKKGYEAIIWRTGKAFKPDGEAPLYTTRGLGVFYKAYLPLVTRAVTTEAGRNYWEGSLAAVVSASEAFMTYP